jgi:hypothetical protein
MQNQSSKRRTRKGTRARKPQDIAARANVIRARYIDGHFDGLTDEQIVQIDDEAEAAHERARAAYIGALNADASNTAASEYQSTFAPQLTPECAAQIATGFAFGAFGGEDEPIGDFLLLLSAIAYTPGDVSNREAYLIAIDAAVMPALARAQGAVTDLLRERLRANKPGEGGDHE